MTLLEDYEAKRSFYYKYLFDQMAVLERYKILFERGNPRYLYQHIREIRSTIAAIERAIDNIYTRKHGQ